ncbi:Glutathione S-transferase domain-containing protein [Rhizobium sp. PDO1-076]|uniref:glutathione S-transferase family protein n=1 Tax=Rhizobium sp. PDO1-076 TaxID=1125979 RepID=UPI00024E358C|nr:glutathione S-transferase family protein [Rhizobium sp. PDO1-076]EHS52751.1 Glutathione S-transferase domain-containing protein [Rhizobium sp. PDO1-076]
MLKIYGVYKSRATRILWLAEELRLSFELVPVLQAYKLADPMAPDARLNTRSPEFLKVNPMGSIPTIDDDGLVLNESLAQTLYLAKKHGGPLAPKDIAEEALMQQWTLFGATSIETEALKISQCNNEGRLSTEAGQSEAKVVARILARPFGVLEKHFAAHDYAVGDRFTVADINLGEIVRYAQAYQPLFDAHPKTGAWLKRIQDRPGFKAMWQKRDDEK